MNRKTFDHLPCDIPVTPLASFPILDPISWCCLQDWGHMGGLLRALYHWAVSPPLWRHFLSLSFHHAPNLYICQPLSWLKSFMFDFDPLPWIAFLTYLHVLLFYSHVTFSVIFSLVSLKLPFCHMGYSPYILSPSSGSWVPLVLTVI